MADALAELNDKQKEKLKQLRANVQDILKPEHDDYYLVRWLIARKCDLRKAEDMLRKHVTWRKEHDVDNILAWQPPEVLMKYMPGGYTGNDKQGHPVWVDRTSIDMKGLLLSAKKKDIYKFGIWRAEMLQKFMGDQTKKLGRRIDMITVVNDMEPLSLKQLFAPGMAVFKELMAMYQDNYPEIINASYAIKAPRIFPIVFNIIKPWLDERTRKRMHVLGGDYKTKLMAVIDADQFPVHWGGSQTDPDGDPYCRSKVNLGGPIPDYYYLKDQEAFKDVQFEVLTVPRGECKCLTFEVSEPGPLLSWVFMTEDHDIKFSVLYIEADDKQTELVTGDRVLCHMVPEDGCIECTKPGVYVLKFDNTYSWVHTKKIKYSAHVTVPENTNIDLDAENIDL